MNEKDREMQHQSNLAEYNAKFQSDLELFKSVIMAGQSSLKAIILINGAASVALLAFVGSIWGEDGANDIICQLLFPMKLFVVGVFLGGVATGITYLIQYFYSLKKNKIGTTLNVISNIIAFVAYILFLIGCMKSLLIFGK